MLDLSFHITTPRLYISHLDPSNDAHCNFIFELRKMTLSTTTAEMKAHYSLPDVDAARKNLQANFDQLDQTGWGRYLVSLKPSPNSEAADETPFPQLIQTCSPVGIVTMQLARFPGAPTIPDIGFGLDAQHHGKGYATEAALALMNYYQATKGVKAFSGICHPENEASQKVLRRLGFENRGVREVQGITGEGKFITSLVWTKGVEGLDLEQFGF